MLDKVSFYNLNGFSVNILTFHYFISYLDQTHFKGKMGASHLQAEHEEEVNKSHQKQRTEELCARQVSLQR